MKGHATRVQRPAISDGGAVAVSSGQPARPKRQHPSDQQQVVWRVGGFFADQVLAAALLDRLLHVSTTINIPGQNHRRRVTRKAGVFQEAPLPAKESGTAQNT